MNPKTITRKDCLLFKEFDSLLNIDTAIGIKKIDSGEFIPDVKSNDKLYKGSKGYQPISLYWIDEVNKYLNSILDISSFTFVDIGSGKGRVLFHTLKSGYNYKKYIGVEIDKDLYNISEKNKKNINIDASKISFLNHDALEYIPIGYNFIYFLFYPFDKDVYNSFVLKWGGILKRYSSYLVFVFEQDYEVYKDFGQPLQFDNVISIYRLNNDK